MRVRWIDVGGTSWDVIIALALKYSAPPSPTPAGARRRPPPRSKADYCSQHLFNRILVHTLTSSSSSPSFSDDRAPENASSADTFTGIPRSESPAQIDDEEEDDLKHPPSSTSISVSPFADLAYETHISIDAGSDAAMRTHRSQSDTTQGTAATGRTRYPQRPQTSPRARTMLAKRVNSMPGLALYTAQDVRLARDGSQEAETET
ncbi:hypothetical protein BD309DRAFT_1023878 [Dichomitus squalens]|nr:hypothetical protein BD309DRAFT_1023878 [Dichomitus squalens]